MNSADIELKETKKQAVLVLESCTSSSELDSFFDRYLGKKGELAKIFASLAGLSDEERKIVGREANFLKVFLTAEFEKKAKEMKSGTDQETPLDAFDVTRPGEKIPFGHLHPLTIARRDVEDIFQSMGFSVAEGPEIENEWYNFDALNIPKDHPARDVWDTFWLKADTKKLLLRTHTSPVQVRYMEKHKPPLRIIAPGNVFRHEATDPSHEFQLFQVEGLMVDKNISVANFKAVINEFFGKFFDMKITSRLKPDFFPFTEPSFEVGISCLVCGGKGCGVCKRTGWMEVAGAGMVHPNVFKSCNLSSKDWQGWAFGFGLERLAMLKYKIDDIRLFRSGDMRFLNQF